MAWLLFLVLCVLFASAYTWGHHDGRDEGYAEGYLDGYNSATDKWQPSDSVRVIPPRD